MAPNKQKLLYNVGGGQPVLRNLDFMIDYMIFMTINIF